MRGDGRGPLNPVTGSVNTQGQHVGEGQVPNLPSGTVANNAASSAIDASNTPQSKEHESNTEGESSTGEKSSKEEKNSANGFSAELAKLEEAYSHRVLYIIGKEQMKIKPSAGIFRKALLHAFLWVRDNTRTKIANLRVPTDRVIEVGFVSKFFLQTLQSGTVARALLEIDVLQDSLSPFSPKSDSFREIIC